MQIMMREGIALVESTQKMLETNNKEKRDRERQD